MPPTTIGRRPAATSASISAWARRAKSPARGARGDAAARPSSRCSSRARCCGRRRAGEDLQARVELQRVGRDRDGVLAFGAQQLGQRDRDLRLPHPRGSEQRDDGSAGTARRIAVRPRGATPAGCPGRGVRSVCMGVRIGSGLSTEADARFGAAEAAAAARDALGGRECDVAVVFAAGAHLAAPEATLEGVHDVLGARRARRLRRGRSDRRAARGRGRHGRLGVGGRARRRRGRRRSMPRSRRSATAAAC